MQKLLLVNIIQKIAPQAKSGKHLSSKYGFSPDLGGKNDGVLSMRMQVILDSSFARPGSVGSVPLWGGKKGEFRDWTSIPTSLSVPRSNMMGVYRLSISKSPLALLKQ